VVFTFDKISLAEFLWQNFFDKIFLSKFLFQNFFGKISFLKFLWQNFFGKKCQQQRLKAEANSTSFRTQSHLCSLRNIKGSFTLAKFAIRNITWVISPPLLALASLGSVTQIEIILFVLHHPR